MKPDGLRQLHVFFKRHANMMIVDVYSSCTQRRMHTLEDIEGLADKMERHVPILHSGDLGNVLCTDHHAPVLISYIRCDRSLVFKVYLTMQQSPMNHTLKRGY